MGRIKPILGIASASFLVALGVYCFARIYPPEIITPLQATQDLLAVHSDVFGSAPSLFYTLAVGLIIGAFASTPTNAKVHCLIWISLTMILEASQHPAVADPIASWLAETLSEPTWGLVGAYWTLGVFDQFDLLASVIGGSIALAILTCLSSAHCDERS